MTIGRPFPFDPLSAAFAADPYSAYRELRSLDEPPYFDATDMYMLSRYEDVAAIARHPAMVRSLRGYVSADELAQLQRRQNFHDMPFHERVVQSNLLESDGAEHRRLRRQVFGAFRDQNIERLAPEISAFVNRLLDRIDNAAAFDFLEDFAAHIPGFTIGRFLGAPSSDAPQLRRWSEDVVRYFDVDRTAAKKARAETATKEFYSYLYDLMSERRRAPQDDLLSQMVADQERGAYGRDECLATAMLILMAGHGSSIDMLGSAMHLMTRAPKIARQLRTTPALWRSALQEMFRFEPPLPFFHRYATEPIEIRGRVFEPGTTFGLLYGAANRDPSAFDHPDAFWIDRSPNRHLAFGHGAHLCLGNHLARLNMQIVFEALFARSTSIELADKDVVYKRGLSVRGPEALFIRLRRNEAA